VSADVREEERRAAEFKADVGLFIALGCIALACIAIAAAVAVILVAG
jgi:hypothetical protein